MKMLKNELEADASATSRTPILSPPSTKRVDDLRCAARPPARLAHDPHDPYVEDEAVAEDAAVDEVPVRRKQKKKNIKTRVFLPPSPEICGRCGHAMARKRKRRTTRRRRPRRVSQVGGVGASLPIGIMKAGYGITKAIGDHQTKRAIAIGEKRRREVASGKRKKYAGESFNCSIM